MKTVDFLDALKRKLDLSSDYALAAALGITRQKTSNYRRGADTFGDETALRVAELGDWPAAYVLACMAEERAERAERPAVKKVWHEVAKALAPFVVGVAVGIGALFPMPRAHAALTPDTAAGQCILCQVVRRWLRSWRLLAAFLGLFAAPLATAEDLYLTASIGRAEYPFKAFDQVTMPNSEQNQTTLWSVSAGWRAMRHLNVEVGYYDFGDVQAQGCYAEEPGVNGFTGPGLNYNESFCAHSAGFAKGTALTILPHVTVYGYTLSLRGGVIRAKSKWSRSLMPDEYGHHYEFAETYTVTVPMYGIGIGRNGYRLELLQADIQPHGESAFGKVRAVNLSVTF